MARTINKTRPDQTRELNRERVLAELRRSGGASRTEISRRTGLSAATVSAITADFFDERLVRANAPEAGRRGRPTVSLMFDPDAALVCAVYFEFSKVSVTLIDYAGETVANRTLPLDAVQLDHEIIRTSLIKCIEDAMALIETRYRLSRIAVGFQGVTSVDGTVVLWSPITRERDVPIVSWLEDAFSVPASVSNDCDMMVRALNWREPERLGENFAAVLLAHGVGMGLFLRGNVINGTLSSGVEFGHMVHIPDGALCRCGNHGCIEAYAGDYAINRAATGQAEDAPPVGLVQSPDLVGIRNSALNEDKMAIAAIESAGRAIGSGIANLYALVDEFPIVLVGQGAGLFDLMEKPLRDSLATAPGTPPDSPVDIFCYLDDGALVQEGCALAALMAEDTAHATQKGEQVAVA